MYDVAIIGAGPAGSAAAIELARAGRRVLMIEKKPFPRSKVCGGCLSGPGALRLRQLLGPHRELPGIPGSLITFVIGSYRLTCHPDGATRIIPRDQMDACLADAAAEEGVEIRYGRPATIDKGTRGWDLIVESERIRTGSVLIASGLNGFPAKLGIRNKSKSRPMIAQQWIQPARSSLPPLGGLELHWLRGGYVGLATPRADECVVAIACDAPDAGWHCQAKLGSGSSGAGVQSRFNGCAGESAFDRLRRLNPTAEIWDLLPADAPRRYGAKGTAGFPWIPDRLGRGNALLIGDAAGYAEPYSGEGIGQAMCSAACAAQAVLEGGDILTAYTSLMRQHHNRIVRRTRWLRAILRTPIVQYLASRRPILPQQWLASLVEGVHVKGSAL